MLAIKMTYQLLVIERLALVQAREEYLAKFRKFLPLGSISPVKKKHSQQVYLVWEDK